MTRRNFAAGLAATFAVSRARAQAPARSPAEMRGSEIVAKTIDALGGDAFRFMRSRLEAGRAYSFYRDAITGLSYAELFTRYVDEGAVKEQQRQVFGKKHDDAVILTATSAWEINFRGARPLGDEHLRQFIDTTLRDVFYILRARRDEPGMVFEHKGKEVVENSPVETIEIYDSENRNVTVWIHSSTFLPVKQRFTRWDPVVSDRHEEVTRFTKYRDAGNGVMWPHDIQRERDGYKVFELYSDKVRVGEPVNDSLFALPPGVHVIKPK